MHTTIQPQRSSCAFLYVLAYFLSLSLLLSSAAASREWQCPLCAIEELVDRVDQAELERYVRELSGADKIYVNGDSITLVTRYARSDQKHLALQYLCDRAVTFGYDPFVQTFFMGRVTYDQQALTFSRSLDTLWVGGNEGKVFMATEADGWSDFVLRESMDQRILGMTTDTEGRLWFACGFQGSGLGGLYVSEDGALSWELVASGEEIYTLHSVAFDHERYGVTCGAFGTVLTTGDWGQTWWRKDPSLFQYQSLYGCAMTDSTHFWVVSSGGYIYESIDAGVTWTSQSFGYRQLFDIDFSGARHGVVVGSRLILYTSDGGVTWNEKVIGSELRCVAMADTTRVIAGGVGGALYLSEDGGASWSAVNIDCIGAEDLLDAQFTEDDILWLCGRSEAKRLELELLPDPDCYFYDLTDTIWGKNVAFRLEGRDAPEHRVMLCAHYDSRSTPIDNSYICAPGADDNGTGVAGVLEAARLLADGITEYSVEFVLFDGEEIGFQGSSYYADNLDIGAEYEAVINLDMLGYDRFDDMSIAIAGRDDPEDSVLSETIIDAIGLLAVDLVPHYTTASNLTSDHISFYDLGVGSVLLIEGERVDLTPFYHTCGDVAVTIDFPYFTQCVKGALGAVAMLAGYEGQEDPIPVDRIVLEQNVPNPFFANTQISFALPRPMAVELAVYDVSGRRVAVIESGWYGPERVTRVWDGRNSEGRKLSSGIYFLRLSGGGYEAVRKLVLLR
ncbi:MAG: M20/M25/M40 family metallo-hydrolase [bacterium]|nr:MAG: M20/M25/M40 family metallo-hydrolase [bacterium]